MTVLESSNLRKTFFQGSTDIEVLRGLNLSVNSGETIAILGESGSGKSTLLSLLTGLDLPTSGEVRVLGNSVSTMSEQDLSHLRAEKVGIVFQQFHLMSHLNALENVTLPLEILNRPNPEPAARALLERVRLGHRLDHFPHQLSGGECQRVAIARALVTRPPLLLADEPTGNLDPRTAKEVVELFFELVSEIGTSLILVTHSMDVAHRCSRRLFLRDGVLSPA